LERHFSHKELPRRPLHDTLEHLRLHSEFKATAVGSFLARATTLTHLIIYTEQTHSTSLLKLSLNERLCGSLTELCWLANSPEQEAPLAQRGKVFDSLLPNFVNLNLLTLSSTIVSCQVLHLLPPPVTHLILVGLDLVGFTDGYEPFAEVLQDQTRVCSLCYLTVHDGERLWEEWEKASLNALCFNRGIRFTFSPGIEVSQRLSRNSEVKKLTSIVIRICVSEISDRSRFMFFRLFMLIVPRNGSGSSIPSLLV
jgi:hypothetical protein